MLIRISFVIYITIQFFLSGASYASDSSPWGVAKESREIYEPQRVLYDLTTGNEKKLKNILDRVGFIYKTYNSDSLDSSIVIIIHGESIPFFSISNSAGLEVMRRAYSLTVGTSIEFRLCQASAKVQGYKPKDIHGFVKMVPMADAEIVKLQKHGYAYMQ